MNVLFTHGYFLHEDLKEQAIMMPYPPLGLLYLSAWLDLHDVENEVFDTTFSTKDDLKKYLLAHRPRIVALYVNLMTKMNIIEIMRFVRAEESLKNTIIVLGGHDVTHNVEDYLVRGADLIVIGEGEQTMLEVVLAAFSTPPPNGRGDVELSATSSRTPLPFGGGGGVGVPGLAFLLPDGSVFKTAPREKMRNIDGLPFPARQKIDLQQYLDVWTRVHGHSSMSINTQRGCPYTCRWCSTPVYGQSHRRRSPTKVADEIEWLQRHYSFDQIWFVDDVFTMSHKWLYAFRDELKIRDLQIKFECITRSDRLNEEVIQVLKECGCFRVWIGAESGSQRVIDAMDRRVELGQVREMIKAAKRAGIEAGTFIMLGYPGETEADILETVEHLKDSNPDFFTITVVYPIKGTSLHEEVQTTAFSKLAWEERTDRDLDFQHTYPRRYYDFAVRWTVNSVNFHKKKLEGKQFSVNGLKLRGKAWAARAGMTWWRFISATPARNSS